MPAQSAREWVILGKVAGAQGLRGWTKLHSYTEPRASIINYNPLYLDVAGSYKHFRLSDGKAHGKGVIARFEGINDRDSAEQLIGCTVAVTRAQLPDLENGEYYWSDLQGLQVINQDGTTLGTVDHVFSTGANDVIVVHGDRKRLIPFLRDRVIVSVDLPLGKMRVDWDADF